MRSVLPALAIVLAQGAQPSTPSKSVAWCFENTTGSSSVKRRRAECNELRELNTEIAKSPRKRIKPPAPPNSERQTRNQR
jgi:hypothetical protein